MINKKLEDIKPEDLQNLIVNGVSESKTIEYKSELPLNTGDAKKGYTGRGVYGTLLKRLNVG
ncbi:MAG: hypothetical protein Q7R35_08145 [Elusimicrobiota bacterium]|nr:hypothetical protein [Elusimicrobiota bacterium]